MIVQRSLNWDKITIIVLEAFLLVFHYFVPTYFVAIRIILGLVSYVFIPGFLFIKALNINWRIEEYLGISPLLGFSIHLLVMTVFWGLFIEPLNFVIFPLITIASVSILTLKNPSVLNLKFKKEYFPSSLLFVVVLAMITRSYYFFANNYSIAIDAGLYCDFARTIVLSGRFESKILNDMFLDPYFNAKGYMNYPLTVFSIALFFFFGDISYASAKAFTLFIGVLVTIFVYLYTNELFGGKTAFIAGLLVAFLPLLNYYSAILHGPEILSTLFALAAIYLFIKGIRNYKHKLHYTSLAGLFAAMNYGAWGIQSFILLITSLALIFVVFNFENKKLCLYNMIIMGFLIYLVRLTSIPYIEFFLTLILVCNTILLYKKRSKNLNYIAIALFVLVLVILLQVINMRNYLAPYVYMKQSEKTITKEPLRVLNLFTFTAVPQVNMDYIWNTLARFWKSIAIILTPILSIISAGAFFNRIRFRENVATIAYPLVASLLLSYSLHPEVAWYGEIFPDRFLITTACFITILSAQTINMFLSYSIDTLMKIYGRKRIIKLSKFLISFLTFIIIVGFLMPSHLFYLNRFNRGYNNIHNIYSLDAVEWIKSNTPSNTVFLAADPRRWAWLTNRNFVQIATPINFVGGTTILNAQELNFLIQKFNVTYVILDNFLVTYVQCSSLIHYLYSASLATEQVYPIIDDNLTLQIFAKLTSSNVSSHIFQAYGLKLIYEKSLNESNRVRIYKVVKSVFSLNVIYKDDFTSEWKAGNGRLQLENGSVKLIINEGKNYAFTYRTTPLNVSLNRNFVKFFSWKVIQINDVKIERIEIWDNKMRFVKNLIPPSSTGIWFTYIDTDVDDIGDLRIVIKGSPKGSITFSNITIGIVKVEEA